MPDRSPRVVTNAEQARLASLEAKLNQILDKELVCEDCGFLVNAAEVLEEKAFALRIEAAKRGKLNGNKPIKQRHLGVYQGVFLI